MDMKKYYAILFLGITNVEIIARGFNSEEEAKVFLQNKVAGRGSGCFIQSNRFPFIS